jgi:hypothetical protein
MGAAVKFVYGYSQRDEDTLSPGREDFTTALVDLKLDGALNENVVYAIEMASSWNQDLNAGSLNGPSNPNDIGTAGIRQASITFLDMVPWTTVRLGTFIPPLMNYMPRPVTDLDLIQYPLINNASRMNTGIFGNRPTPRDFSTWQQAGFNITFQPPNMITLDIGCWDGIMPNNQANNNPNLAKATSIAATFQPHDVLSFSMAYWGEEFQPGPGVPGVYSGAKRQLTMWSLYGAYHTDLLEVTADYSMGMIPEYQLDNSGELNNLSWNGWQATVGYWIRPELEIIGRYEYLNPNAEDSVQIVQSRYDESRWITMGVNWRLNGRAEVALNYVLKDEMTSEVEEGEPGEDPNLPGYNPKFSEQKNDLFLLQVMIWQ